jgi:hypothetical protein
MNYPTPRQLKLNAKIATPYVEVLERQQKYREAYRHFIGMMEYLSAEDFKKLRPELNKIDKYLVKMRDK